MYAESSFCDPLLYLPVIQESVWKREREREGGVGGAWFCVCGVKTCGSMDVFIIQNSERISVNHYYMVVCM